MEPIAVKYIWTADELIEARRCHMRVLLRRPFRIGLYGIAIFFFVGGLAILFAEGNSFIGWAITLFPIVCYGLWPAYIRIVLRYHFRKRPDKDISIEWEIADDLIVVRSERSYSQFTWSVLARVAASSTGLLFYPNYQVFQWLPRHGFTSQADFEHASEIAQANCKQFLRID
jgi:hypothetical protein